MEYKKKKLLESTITKFYINDDCLNILSKFEKDTFDLIISDINFGNFNHSNERAHQFGDYFTDEQFKKYYKALKRILSPRGTLVAFGFDFITYQTIDVLKDIYKYSLVWEKNKMTGHLNINRRPLIKHNDIMIFQKNESKGKFGEHIYNPQKFVGEKRYAPIKWTKKQDNCFGVQRGLAEDTDLHYPNSILNFPPNPDEVFEIPMQKPQALMDWIVASYSAPDSIILDPCMGMGTTALSAKQYDRRYVGIEINPDIYQKAKERIKRFVYTNKIEL